MNGARQYRRGAAFELRVRDKLKDHGYFAARTPGSKTPVDVTGVRADGVLFIQCKRNGKLAARDWNELVRLAASVNATPILASIPESGRGIALYRLTGEKPARSRTQPREPFTLAAEEARTA